MIPIKLRNQLRINPFYKRCCLTGRIDKLDWHHAYIYKGRQIQEEWNILPVVWFKHSPNGNQDSIHNCIETRNRAKLIALERADLNDLQKRYPKFNWVQEYERIKNYIGNKTPNS